MINEDIDPKLLHKYAKTQQTETSFSHVIAKYVPDRNLPTRLGENDKYVMSIYRGCMHIYAKYEVTGTNYSVRSTVHILDIYY